MISPIEPAIFHCVLSCPRELLILASVVNQVHPEFDDPLMKGNTLGLVATPQYS